MKPDYRKTRAYLVIAGNQPVMNISQVGVSIQTRHSLIIGQRYPIYMYSEYHNLLVDGLVVRCSLSELAEMVDGHREPRYVNGIEFHMERNPKEERLLGIIQENIYGEKRIGSSRVTPIKPLFADVCTDCFPQIERLTTSSILLECRELLDMEKEWTLLLFREETCTRLASRIIQAAKKEDRTTFQILFEFIDPSQEEIDFVGHILTDMIHPEQS